MVEFWKWKSRVSGTFLLTVLQTALPERSGMSQKLSFGGWRCRNRITSSQLPSD